MLFASVFPLHFMVGSNAYQMFLGHALTIKTYLKSIQFNFDNNIEL